MDSFTILLQCAIASGTSILFAAVAEVITERSGVLNLGLEGIMLGGAFSGFLVAHLSNSLALAVTAAFLFGALFGFIHSVLTILMRANQVVSGLSITILGGAVASFFGKSLVGKTAVSFTTVHVPYLSEIPLAGCFFRQNSLVYFSYLFVIVTAIFLYRTRFGLYLRVIGESPATADSMGLSVIRYRIAATVIGSGFAAIGGAYLSLADTPSWMDQMTAGRGWIAISIVIFAAWNPVYAALGSYLFGGLVALQFRLQALGFEVNIYFLKMLPYLITLLSLVIFSSKKFRKIYGPIASLGIPYDRESK